MHSPYLVKQFITSDLDNSAYSKIYWLYKPQNNDFDVGIGLFFEVVSSDLETTVYEYISKGMWDVFIDVYYKKGIESALQRAAFTFLSLLQQVEVEELDVNFGFWVIRKPDRKKEQDPVDNKYVLDLAIFGELDVILLRNGQYVNIFNHVPKNETLKNLKYTEVGIDPEDMLFVSNRMLLENAFESDIIKTGSVADVLQSLTDFEKTLTGNKKVFFIGVETQLQSDENPEIVSDGVKVTENTLADKIDSFKTKTLSILSTIWFKTGDIAFKKLKDTQALTNIKNKVVQLKERIKPKKASEENLILEPVPDEVPEITTEDNVDYLAPIEDGGEYIEQDQGDLYSVESNTEAEHPEENATENTEKIVEKKETEHITTSEQQESFSQAEEKTASNSVFNVLDPQVKNDIKSHVNPVQEFRLRHSNKGKFMLLVQKLIHSLKQDLVSGIKNVFNRNKKTTLTDYSHRVRNKNISKVYFIGGLLVLVILFLLVRSYRAKKAELTRVNTFVTNEVQPLFNFYEQDIEPLKVTDEGHMLELCFKQVSDVKNKISSQKKNLKYSKSVQILMEKYDGVEDIERKCRDKYDKIYNITRVNDAILVKDFSAELGTESTITDMNIFKGLIYVIDGGKKAVYQLNPDNNNLLKLEDPNGLVKEPISINANKDVILVCDAQNGILEYKNNKFAKIVGTSPDSTGSSCVKVAGFYTNAYFVLKDRDVLYKSVGYTGGYALPNAYITDAHEILDVIIDGNVYLLRKVKTGIKLYRYFQGRFDASFKLKENIDNVTMGYSNPSGNFPIYLFDSKMNGVRVVEKPTSKKHPGYGVIIKTYILDNKDKFSNVKSIAVDLSLNTNKENYLYVVANNILWKIPLTKEK